MCTQGPRSARIVQREWISARRSAQLLVRVHWQRLAREEVRQDARAVGGEDVAQRRRDGEARHAVRSLRRLVDVYPAEPGGGEVDSFSDRNPAEVAAVAVLDVGAHQQ